MAHIAVTAPAFTTLDLPGGERNLIGLARVSTDAQDAQLQQDALTEAGCARIYVEKISTRKAATDRPGLVAALDYLRPGDTLVVWKLDRLGRSVKDVLTIADDLHARGIGVRILTGKLSGSYSPTGEGKFFFTMMAPPRRVRTARVPATFLSCASLTSSPGCASRPWAVRSARSRPSRHPPLSHERRSTGRGWPRCLRESGARSSAAIRRPYSPGRGPWAGRDGGFGAGDRSAAGAASGLLSGKSRCAAWTGSCDCP